jgi:DnaJ family protein C protein 11
MASHVNHTSTPDDDADEASLYAVLNVPRDASEEDIRRAFRALAQACHPDKHTTTDAALQAHASASFTRLQEAYEVCRVFTCLWV